MKEKIMLSKGVKNIASISLLIAIVTFSFFVYQRAKLILPAYELSGERWYTINNLFHLAFPSKDSLEDLNFRLMMFHNPRSVLEKICKKDGEIKKYYPTGELFYSGKCKNGKIDGVYSVYSYGVFPYIIEEGSYKDGNIEWVTEYDSYDGTGTVQYKTVYSPNQLDEKEFYKSGELKEERLTSNNICIINNQYYESGALERRWSNDRGFGFYEDGVTKELYTCNDNLSSTCNYQEFFKSGKLKRVGFYKRLRLSPCGVSLEAIGEVKSFDERGNVNNIEIYSDFKNNGHSSLERRTTFYASGNTECLFVVEDKNNQYSFFETCYYDNGLLREERKYNDESAPLHYPAIKTKKFYSYYPNKATQFTDIYKGEKLIERIAYDENGKIKFKQKY